MFKQIKGDLKRLADPKRAKVLQGFFKTGKGEYGEGDIFIGITVPEQRKVAKKYIDIKLKYVEKLLNSKIHEERLTAVLILVEKFQRSEKLEKEKIVKFYLRNTKKVNNWDLVDSSADKILGAYILKKDKQVLYKLAKSKNLWERRISIVATFYFIKNNKFQDTLKIAEILLNDEHQLIHKAVGWMLREVGKRDQKIEERFLKKYYKIMPRTMLRYSIERFEKKKKEFYMK